MKKTMIGMMLGGAAMFGYMKYMDGSIQRGIKNMKPKFKLMLENIKEKYANFLTNCSF